MRRFIVPGAIGASIGWLLPGGWLLTVPLGIVLEIILGWRDERRGSPVKPHRRAAWVGLVMAALASDAAAEVRLHQVSDGIRHYRAIHGLYPYSLEEVEDSGPPAGLPGTLRRFAYFSGDHQRLAEVYYAYVWPFGVSRIAFTDLADVRDDDDGDQREPVR